MEGFEEFPNARTIPQSPQFKLDMALQHVTGQNEKK
jgi:hypothetical protein